jgi:signal transduction histidine kinase
MESFLDDYQKLRFLVSLSAFIVVGILGVSGWWRSDSPVVNLLVLGLIALHAAWCRFRHVRAPRTMLVIDTTLMGASMVTINEFPSVMTGVIAFLALIVVLFSEGPWMVGLFAYLTALYVTAFLSGSGASVESAGNMVASLTSVAAVVAVMIRVRRWLGRLDADRSQMIGTVSHELRNNLTGVLGLTDIVANTADLQPAEARELIALAHQQAVDANEIVEDLLTASRLEAAALTISAGRVDINAEVATVARRFNGVGSEIGLVLADDLGAAWADPLRVRQAIRNLVSNAIRYGGPVVSIATRQKGDAIQISVLDNGDGVPKEDEASIFLPYRRSTTGRRDPSSIGLGLWICRHLAQAMGGHLVYERRDGSTEFVLTVPVARPDQNPTRAPASAAHIPVPFILSH